MKNTLTLVGKRMIRKTSPLWHCKFRGFKSKNGFARLYHLHNRKCAGTSINKAILSGLGGKVDTYEELAKKGTHCLTLENKPVVGWTRGLINREAFFYGFSHEPLDNLCLSDDTFIFAFLRNPLDRLCSHFNMLCDMAASQPSHLALHSEAEWATGNFSEFLSKIPKRHACNQLYMFDTNFDISTALQKLERVNFVEMAHKMGESFIPLLGSEFGINAPYSPLRRSVNKVKPTDQELKKATQIIEDEIIFYQKACARLNSLR